MTAARELPFLATGGAMGDRIARFDWSTTPLGPITSWPVAFRNALAISLDTRQPALVAWGPRLTLVHNDAFAALADGPLLGEPADGALDRIAPAMREVLVSGRPSTIDERAPEPGHEKHLTWSTTPIRDEAGNVVGVLATAEDVTARVVAERRLLTLRALHMAATAAATPDDAAAAVVDVLATNPTDLPYLLLYRGQPGVDEARVVASHGVSDGRVLLDMRWPPPNASGDDQRTVVLPLVAAGAAAPRGMLVVGTNPNLPLDDDYRGFLDLVAAHVSVAVAGWVGTIDLTERHRRAEDRRRAAQAELERSEAAFRLLAERSDDVIGRHELDGTWRYVSPSVERVVGYPPSDLVGQSPLDVVHPDDHAAFAAALRGLDTASPTARLTLRLRHAEGGNRWFELRLRHVHDTRAGEAELHSSLRDVTDQLLAQEELSRIREVTERAGDLIAIVDADGRGLYLNPAGRRMLGIDPEQPANALMLLDVVAPSARDRFADSMAAADDTGSWTGSIDLVDSAGTPIPAWLAIVAHRDVRGTITFYSAVAQDLRQRERADEAIYEERERYRSLVAQVAVGIWMSNAEGVTTFVNDHGARLVGRGPEEITSTTWASFAHPDDRDEAVSSWSTAVKAGEPWQHEYRIVNHVDGDVRDVTSSARPLRSADGAVTGFLGTTVDVTDQRRAELARREAATEHAARKASEEAAARLRAMVEGLAAIVWEAEWREDGIRHTFVSDRAEELLGYPAEELLGEPLLWPRLVHPDDRDEALGYSAQRTAAGVDHDLTYRAVAVDGRIVWLHQVVHVVAGPDGSPLRVQGLAVDVTEQKRAERSTELLAETGRLLADEGTAAEKLVAIARLVARDLGDAAVVSMVGPDGLLRRTAAVTDDAETERRLLRKAPVPVPPELAAEHESGRAVAFPVTDEPDVTGTLVVPLVVDGRMVGKLGFPHFGRPRHHDRADLDLATELGRRASLMLATERQRDRERHMQQINAELASADSVAEAARRLVSRLGTVLGASATSVCLVEPERGIRLVHAAGHTEAMRAAFATVRFDDPVPVAEAVRTGAPVWIRDLDEWRTRWPGLMTEATDGGLQAAAMLPLTAGGQVVGVIGLGYPTPRVFPPDEREFLVAMVAQAASAFERAATADERRLIAETLQRSLLPPELPVLERLALAASYLPGAHGTRAGGDWYDVLEVDGGVAVAVGDVVGQGAQAAAVMGQLRSALSGYLLEGHGPVEALERLDRFASRVPGAAGSTVACVVLEPETGQLTLASAGHLPPLVVGPSGARYLTGARGTVLAVRGRPPYEAGHARIQPGESLVLYTDGLVERRGEVVDVGLDRLATSAAEAHLLAPTALADTLLAALLDRGPNDDVAVIVARLVPAPLRLVLPAEPAQLRPLRSAVSSWAAEAGISGDDAYDLQLALGEAAANAVEHAYRDGPVGTMAVELVREGDGRVRVSLRDEGIWRPEPADRGHRGRGLDMIREVSERMQVRRSTKGTDVRFEIPPPPPALLTPLPHVPDTASPGGPTRLRVSVVDGSPAVEVLGDLDVAGVEAVRAELLAATSGAASATVDLSATTYLSSAGVAMLVEAAAQTTHGRVQVTTSGGVVRRMLALSGVDDVLDVHG